MKTLRKNKARVLAIIIMTCMFFTLAPIDNVSAASLTDKTYVDEMVIGNDPQDQVKITKSETDPNAFVVSCTHSLGFDRMDVRAYKYGTSTTAQKPKYIYEGVGAGESWTQEVSFKGLKNATYRLSVYKENLKEPAGMEFRPYVDRITFVKNKSGVHLVDYAAIRKNNNRVRNLYEPDAYREKDLDDLKFIVFNKAGTKTRRTIKSTTEKNYYKKVSDSIVSSGDSDYVKMRKLFAYSAKNLYFDNYKKSKPYDDPYYNLRHVNKLDSKKGYNWSNGKVAVQCDGYAAFLIALGRAQDIPCRMVTGNLLSSSGETWETEKPVKRQTHCWVQAYVDGRWIDIDPCRGTLNKRNSNGSWTKGNQIYYMFFDMNDVQLAHTHCSISFYGGDRNSAFMYDSAEISQIKKFMNSYGNGQKLNSNYSSDDTSTWSNEKAFYTNGKGNVQFISWNRTGIRGKLNVNDFTALKNVSVANNQITSLTVKNCTNLDSIYACSNKMTTINTSTVKKAKVIDTRYNKLKTAYVYLNKAKRTFVVKGKGTFGFKTNNSKISIYAKPNSGYKVKGIYTSGGKRISSKATCTFKPTAKKYYVRFVKK